MGGTLPVLTRFFTTSVEEVETKVGVLYALNTFGAAAGSLAAALVFIPGIGNIRTTLIIATLNVAIGLFAVWAADAQTERSETETITRRSFFTASLYRARASQGADLSQGERLN